MNKKYIILFIFSFLLHYYSQSQLAFSLKGVINNEQIEKLYFIYYNDIKGIGIRDSTEVQKGNFLFNGNISHGALLVIKLDRGNEIDDKTIFTFINHSNMEVQLNYSPFSVLSITGSPTYLEYNSLNLKKEMLHKKLEDIFKQYISAKDGNIRDSLNALLLPYYEENKNY